jgi:hypothetical protein
MTVSRARSSRDAAVLLSWGIAAMMTFQATAGLLFPEIYRDAAWIRAAWFGCDAVTLLGGVPLIVGGLLALRRGSVRGELLWLAGLGFGVYNYEYFAFGAHLGLLFPLFVALFVGSAWTLILALAGLDVRAIAATFGARTPVRTVATYMAFTGIGLGVAWLAQWGAYVFAGTVPSIGEAPFRLVASMDLSFMVPTFIVGAVLLWRRRAWGYVIAVISITQGAMYTTGLGVASVVGGLRGIPGSLEQAPVWAVWSLVGAAAAVALLWHVDRPVVPVQSAIHPIPGAQAR